jgi:hypothetical protein
VSVINNECVPISATEPHEMESFITNCLDALQTLLASGALAARMTLALVRGILRINDPFQ